MTLMVDTSVWSLAFRRDAPPDVPEVRVLRDALGDREIVVATGLILQEILQGVVPDRVRARLADLFSGVELIQPTHDDHVAAAELRNTCRSAGVQMGTVDALIAQLCIAHELILLTTDQDFVHAARHSDLRVWTGPAAGD